MGEPDLVISWDRYDQMKQAEAENVSLRAEVERLRSALRDIALFRMNTPPHAIARRALGAPEDYDGAVAALGVGDWLERRKSETAKSDSALAPLPATPQGGKK